MLMLLFTSVSGMVLWRADHHGQALLRMEGKRILGVVHGSQHHPVYWEQTAPIAVEG